MTIKHLTHLLFSLICLFGLAACTDPSLQSRAPTTTTRAVTGTTDQRALQIGAIIAKYSAPPSPLLDAQLVEEQTGNNTMGPSDFRVFTMIQVAPESIPQWQKLLTPLTTPATYATPLQARTWWVSQTNFSGLQLYQPGPLTGKNNGWIAIDAQNGLIYMYSFTT